MLTPRPTQQIYLAIEPVDMRGGFDSLAARVLHAGLDLYGGHLFAFLSKRRTHLKILTWDGTGLLVLYKRLSRGCFTIPDVRSDGRTVLLDPSSLATLLAGLRVQSTRSPKSAHPIDTTIRL